jgi:threonyl-tRNA synthetase
VGAREAESGQVSVRNRKHGDQGTQPVEAFIARLEQLIADKATSE